MTIPVRRGMVVHMETIALGIRMPVELKDRLRKLAKTEHRNMSSQVVFMLERAIRERERFVEEQDAPND